VRNVGEDGDFATDPPKLALGSMKALANLLEREFECFHSSDPIVAFFDAQENCFDVHRAQPATGPVENEGFGALVREGA